MIEEPAGFHEDGDEELSLRPVLRTLWSYRRAMSLAFGVTVLCCIVATLFLYARAPRERIASLAFELKFDGAERSEYPNGTKFSSAEIVSSPVLSEVYKANDLQRYTTFPQFKDSVFVLQTNRAIELLNYEYTAKLSDSKLGPVDRARLEEEFRKKRESLSSAGYSLNIQRDERLARMPDALLSKILGDTLSTWAGQTAERKGALRYNIPVLSKNAMQKDLMSEDYIVAVDLLRSKVERILKTIVDMSEIPGAATLRMGPDHIGVADLRANLEDLNQFKVEPLISLIRATGLSKNPVRIGEYFAGRQFEVQLSVTAAQQRVKTLQDALRAYEEPSAPATAPATQAAGGAVTPQLSESFIDRLVQLSTRSIDINYRQGLTKRIVDEGILLADLSRQAQYYESLKRLFEAAHPRADPAVAADVTRRANLVFDDVTRMLDQVQSFYELLSQQNLNPDSVVYTITTPFIVRTTPGLSLSSTLLYMFVVLLMAVVMIPVGCLAHDYFRQWISPRHVPVSQK